MIVTRKACKCALCNWEWLPSPTENNPKADPRKVKRCASCKSFQWNADDPKLLAARLAKVELPKVAPDEVPRPSRLVAVHLPLVLPPKAQDNTSAQPHIANSNEQYEAIMVDSPTPFRPLVVKSTICRHRVLLAHCELCNAAQVVTA